MKICFVDTTKLEYSFKDLNNFKIRGSESSIINLSQKISEFGNDVVVFNNSKYEINKHKYSWLNLDRIKNYTNSFDIVISNNDNHILSKFNSKKKFVLSHSILSLEKAFRKKQLFSYFKNRPKYIFLGKYHKKKMSKLFSLFGYQTLNYAVDDIFNKPLKKFKINNDHAFFTSRQDRNLDILIDIWKNNVFKIRNKSKLFITPISLNLKKFNIFNRKLLEKKKYINEIKKSRMVILPGHKAELFCIAAMEASELNLPIVTMGIGSLSERVDHGITGLISKNKYDFSKNIIELYENKVLWNEIRNNLMKKRGQNTWLNASKNLMKILKK